MGKGNILSLLILTLLIIIFPIVIKDTYLHTIGIFAGINALVAIGLTILMGYAGQISLGQAAFYGIGAYISAILSLHFGLPVILSIFLALLVASTAAIILAIPALRLKGHYLAVATLGFGEIIHIMLHEWGPGGPSGFGDIPKMNLFGFTFTSTNDYFYLVWMCVVVIMIFSLNLINSMTGKALQAMHGSEIATQTAGINLTKLKIKIFILSSIYASLAGAMYAHYVTFLSPSSFSPNIWGGIVGALIITILPEVLRGFKEFDILLYGLILTLFLLFMRKGLVPMTIATYKRWIHR